MTLLQLILHFGMTKADPPFRHSQGPAIAYSGSEQKNSGGDAAREPPPQQPGRSEGLRNYHTPFVRARNHSTTHAPGQVRQKLAAILARSQFQLREEEAG